MRRYFFGIVLMGLATSGLAQTKMDETGPATADEIAEAMASPQLAPCLKLLQQWSKSRKYIVETPERTRDLAAKKQKITIQYREIVGDIVTDKAFRFNIEQRLVEVVSEGTSIVPEIIKCTYKIEPQF
jgi:hypothetical protein